MTMMKAARLHEIGGKFSIDEVPVPKPGKHDVLVRVEACGVIPNLRNVVTHFPTWYPFLPLPALPAIFGLDAAGTIAAVGDGVSSFKPGERVRCRAVCFHRTRSVAFIRVTAWDDDAARPVATATGTFTIDPLPGRRG